MHKLLERSISTFVQTSHDVGGVQQKAMVKSKTKVVDESVPQKPRTKRNTKKKAKSSIMDENTDEEVDCTISDIHIRDKD